MGDEQDTAFAWKLGAGVVAVGLLVVGGFWWAEQQEAAKWAAQEARTADWLRQSEAKTAEVERELARTEAEIDLRGCTAGDADACAAWDAFKEARPGEAERIEARVAGD